MKPRNDRTSSRLPAGSPTPRQRFRIEKLEERIAPTNWKGKGGGASGHCPPSQGGSRCSF
jgi:hypothetical protein